MFIGVVGLLFCADGEAGEAATESHLNACRVRREIVKVKEHGRPRAQAGLLMGEYMCRQAEFLALYESRQPYAEAMRDADRARREMNEAVARHHMDYGTQPVAILSEEQADYVASVTGRYYSYEVVKLERAAEGALVIGRSSADVPLEVATRPALHRDAAEAGQERLRSVPDRSPTHHTEDRDGDLGGYSR